MREELLSIRLFHPLSLPPIPQYSPCFLVEYRATYIRINKHIIRRNKRRIILKEQSRRNLWDLAHDLLPFLNFLVFGLAFGLILLEGGVVLSDYTFYLELLDRIRMAEKSEE
jgi:hypothetical protein